MWTGHEARALRAALRLTIEAFAEHLGVTGRAVAKWEARGSTIVPVPEIQQVLDIALERATPDQQARFEILRRGGPASGQGSSVHMAELWTGAPAPLGPAANVSLDLAWASSSALHMGAGDDTLDGNMKRRAFLFGVPAAVVLWRADLPHLRWGEAAVSVPNEATLGSLVSAVEAEKRLCDQLGSRAVQGLAAENVRLATGLLRNSSSGALRPRLAAVASEAAAEAGFVHADADQRHLPAVHSYYQLAAELAQEAEDPRLEAFVGGSWSRRVAGESYFRPVAGERGTIVRALPYVQRAQVALQGRPSPATSVYLAIVEAELQSAVDPDASLRALERADDALDRSEPGEGAPWLPAYRRRDADSKPAVAWMDVRGSQGYCYMRMGCLDDADAVLSQALADVDPSMLRPRAMWLVSLAFVRLRQQELEACCDLAGQALELSVATGSSTNAQRVRDLRIELEPWKDSAPVKALDEQMAAVLV